MRACILSVVEPRHMVMMSMYTSYFDEKNIPYDLIYMDRYHELEKTTAQEVYRCEIEGTNSISKLAGYIKFQSFARKVLDKNNYDFVAVWNEYTSVLFEKYLMKNYRGKYSVNVRDLFDPDDKIRKPALLYPRLNDSIKGSLFTTVSSGKYLDYLCEFENYIFVHSINSQIMPNAIKRGGEQSDDPIKILYLGKIGYLEEVEKFLKEMCNDTRFTLSFVGVGSEKVKEMAASMGCNNVEFVGKFDSSETNSYLEKADIIYNLYGDQKPCERTALSNKLYYAVCLNAPILVYKNTYMYEVANNCGIAFAADECPKGKLGDELFRWYNNLDKEIVREKCDRFKEDARKSHLLVNKELDTIFFEKDMLLSDRF